MTIKNQKPHYAYLQFVSYTPKQIKLIAQSISKHIYIYFILC